MAAKKSAMAAGLKKVYDTLAEIGGSLVRDEDVERGPKLVIPHSMSLAEASKYLKDRAAAEEEEVRLQRTFPFRPMDGAVAVHRALVKFFGTFSHLPSKSPWGDTPPTFIDVAVGPKEVIQVPWGTVSVPAVPSTQLMMSEIEDEELGEIFWLGAETLRKHRPAVEGLFTLVEEELRRESIYRGKAIDGKFNFLDLSRVDRNKVVYAEEVQKQMDASVFAPIRYPDALRSAGVSLKSAVLLTGTFGVGKTLFAYLTGQECEQHGVTFIQVRPNQDDLRVSMQTAQMYAPAVVFFEDLDTVASAEQAQEHISGLLELFDGVRAKGVEVMGILTTNHPDKIHKGMLRPGRLDAVIEIGAPDGPGIVKLCKAIVHSDLLVEPEENADKAWERVAEAMEGYLPAFVNEACARAIKYALVRNNGVLEKVEVEDLRMAGLGLRAQFDRMTGASDLRQRDTLGEALRGVVAPTIEDVVRGIAIPEILKEEGRK